MSASNFPVERTRRGGGPLTGGVDTNGGLILTGRDQAVWLARAELTARALGTTEQFLAVHEIDVAPGDEPVVARVDEKSEPGAYNVYFPVSDEPYSFVVAVAPDRAGSLRTRGLRRSRRPRLPPRIQRRATTGGDHRPGRARADGGARARRADPGLAEHVQVSHLVAGAAGRSARRGRREAPSLAGDRRAGGGTDRHAPARLRRGGQHCIQGLARQPAVRRLPFRGGCHAADRRARRRPRFRPVRVRCGDAG